MARPGDLPNPGWLDPGFPSAGQEGFGDALLDAHPFALVPSVASESSWSLIFDPGRAGGYDTVATGRFALDPQLNQSLGEA